MNERAFVLGMCLLGVPYVTRKFAHKQIAVAHNAGADDARFIVVDERRVMIQRHELWFVKTEGFFARRLLQLHPAVRAPRGVPQKLLA